MAAVLGAQRWAAAKLLDPSCCRRELEVAMAEAGRPPDADWRVGCMTRAASFTRPSRLPSTAPTACEVHSTDDN